MSMLFLSATLDGALALDKNGNPIAGAELTFWRSGTTALKSVYSDQELNDERDNPVIADANGRFPLIYLESGDYRVRLRKASGVLVWDVDPYVCDCTEGPFVFRMPRHREVGDDGPRPGAELLFTVAETDTPADTYADAARESPHPNPLRADAGGLFPAVYMDDSTQYRVRMVYEGETLIDADPYVCSCGFFLLTSRPYPIESVESIDIAGDTHGGRYQPVFIFPPEPVGIAGSLLGGELRTPVVAYEIDPEGIDVAGTLSSAELVTPLVIYEIEPEGVDVSGTLTGADFTATLLRYMNYPPEGIDIAGSFPGAELE